MEPTSTWKQSASTCSRIIPSGMNLYWMRFEVVMVLKYRHHSNSSLKNIVQGNYSVKIAFIYQRISSTLAGD